LPHLRENGLLYVEVPLGAHTEWNELSEPLTHLNFFSEQSLVECLRLAGLQVIDISTRYVWVTHKKAWCVMALARPNNNTRPVPALSTKRQMSNQYYRFRPFVESRAKRLRTALHRVLRST